MASNDDFVFVSPQMFTRCVETQPERHPGPYFYDYQEVDVFDALWSVGQLKGGNDV